MKAIAFLAATAAIVTLTGCDRLRGGGGGSTNTTANASTPAPASNSAQSADAGGKPAEGGAAGGVNDGGAVPASTGGGSGQLDRTYVMGRWTDDGDCSNVIEFTQDGRFITAEGGTGLWRLEGDRLTMTGQRTATIRIEVIDQDTMTVINTDGSLGRSTRC